MKDVEIAKIIEKEKKRLNESIELIASENVVSLDILEATGSVLTNKYAEGYPGKRYYGGCSNVDEAEILAQERILKMFRADNYSANVQPHSGSQANMAVMLAVLEAGETILGMDLSAGGHLTHGMQLNFSGKLFRAVSYGINSEGLLDYDEIQKIAEKEKPKLIIAGASAYSRTIDFKKFSEIAKSVGAYLLCDVAHIAGLIVAELQPSPVGHADFITTTTHKTLRGPRGGVILCKKEFEKQINSAIFPGIQGGPLMHIIAAKAVAFHEALQPDFIEYQTQIVKNAKIMADTFMKNNIPIISGGTDNHLMLLDLRSVGITGKKAQDLLEEFGITVNKNGIPNDPEKPWITSGIRIGTPAITTRGFKEKECEGVAEIIINILKGTKEGMKDKVSDLCRRFPL